MLLLLNRRSFIFIQLDKKTIYKAEFHIHANGKEELNIHTISMEGFHYSYLKIGGVSLPFILYQI
jgi:hypothetical protein